MEAKKNLLTREGLKKYEDELHELKVIRRKEVAQKIKEAQQEGYDITAETCSHYLSLTDQDVLENGPLFKCAPPLRSQEEVDRLWSYVEDGTFSGIASDHSPCSYDEKFNEIYDIENYINQLLESINN